MTFLQLKALVSYWLDDLGQTYFTPIQLGIFLNNAQKEVQKLLLKANYEWYVVCKQTNLVLNQRDYQLPADFLKLNRLEVVVSGVAPNENVVYLSPITRNQKDMVNNVAGCPGAYYFNKNSITVLPAPNVSYVLKLTYSYLITDMTLDTDMPDVPSQYQELIAVIAARDGLVKDGRTSTLLNEKLEQYMGMLKQDANQRNIDESRQVIQSGGNDYGWEIY